RAAPAAHACFACGGALDLWGGFLRWTSGPSRAQRAFAEREVRGPVARQGGRLGAPAPGGRSPLLDRDDAALLRGALHLLVARELEAPGDRLAGVARVDDLV